MCIKCRGVSGVTGKWVPNRVNTADKITRDDPTRLSPATRHHVCTFHVGVGAASLKTTHHPFLLSLYKTNAILHLLSDTTPPYPFCFLIE